MDVRALLAALLGALVASPASVEIPPFNAVLLDHGQFLEVGRSRGRSRWQLPANLFTSSTVNFTCDGGRTDYTPFVAESLESLKAKANALDRAWCGLAYEVGGDLRTCLTSWSPFRDAYVAVMPPKFGKIPCFATRHFSPRPGRALVALAALALFWHASRLARSSPFRMASGGAVFALLSLLLVLGFAFRRLPARRAAAAWLLAAGGGLASAARYAARVGLPGLLRALASPVGLSYLACAFLVGVAVTYWFDEGENPKVAVLLSAALRLGGLATVALAAPTWEAAALLCASAALAEFVRRFTAWRKRKGARRRRRRGGSGRGEGDDAGAPGPGRAGAGRTADGPGRGAGRARGTAGAGSDARGAGRSRGAAGAGSDARGEGRGRARGSAAPAGAAPADPRVGAALRRRGGRRGRDEEDGDEEVWRDGAGVGGGSADEEEGEGAWAAPGRRRHAPRPRAPSPPPRRWFGRGRGGSRADGYGGEEREDGDEAERAAGPVAARARAKGRRAGREPLLDGGRGGRFEADEEADVDVDSSEEGSDVSSSRPEEESEDERAAGIPGREDGRAAGTPGREAAWRPRRRLFGLFARRAGREEAETGEVDGEAAEGNAAAAALRPSGSAGLASPAHSGESRGSTAPRSFGAAPEARGVSESSRPQRSLSRGRAPPGVDSGAPLPAATLSVPLPAATPAVSSTSFAHAVAESGAMTAPAASAGRSGRATPAASVGRSGRATPAASAGRGAMTAPAASAGGAGAVGPAASAGLGATAALASSASLPAAHTPAVSSTCFGGAFSAASSALLGASSPATSSASASPPGASGGPVAVSPIVSRGLVLNEETGRVIAIGKAEFNRLVDLGYVFDRVEGTIRRPEPTAANPATS